MSRNKGACAARYKERAVSYTLKYLLFAFALLLVSAALYLAYLRFIPKGQSPSPALAEVRGTVILDAGHGGFDGGAVSENGTLEKELNLKITLLLRDLLEASGIDVILTRETDIMLESEREGGSRKTRDLRARVEVAEANPDAVFVSIHMNKFPKASAHGVQLYYSPNDPGGKELAGIIQQAVKQYLQPDNDRPLKAADSAIYVLDRVKNPAVLVECGFLSNNDEEQLLLDEKYQHKLAMLLAVAVNEYISGLE